MALQVPTKLAPERMKTVGELENIQKEINQKALIILNNDFAAPAEAEPLLKTKK